jgi:hypothetical protein
MEREDLQTGSDRCVLKTTTMRPLGALRDEAAMQGRPICDDPEPERSLTESQLLKRMVLNHHSRHEPNSMKNDH